MITEVGDPQVQPSIERLDDLGRPRLHAGLVEHVLERTPWNSALPTRSPPISFDTQDSVM